jgi:hypothetical protein
MRPRLTIALLLAVIALCGVGFAALRSPSQLWASALFAVSLGSLLLALFNAIYSRERQRAFWVGFLVLGGSYFTATQGPWFRDEFGPRMVTTAILDLAYARVAPPPPATVGTLLAQAWTAAGSYNRAIQQLLVLSGPTPEDQWAAWTEPDRISGVGLQVGNLALVSPETFRRIGHSLLMLVFAALGGIYARRLHAGLTP